MQIEQIKPNSTIKLDFSTSFFSRLQSVMTNHLDNIPADQRPKMFENIKANCELSVEEMDLETLLILVNSLENAAREQNLVEMVTLPDAVPETT